MQWLSLAHVFLNSWQNIYPLDIANVIGSDNVKHIVSCNYILTTIC